MLTSNDVAAILNEVAVMLEITGATVFRSRAFRNAAHAVEELTTSIHDLVTTGELRKIRGIGKSIFSDIENLLAHGSFALYDELRTAVPESVLDMLRVSGMGPKKVKLVYDTLGIHSVEDLERAGRDGLLAALPGFGEKTQGNILRAIERMKKYQGRFLLSTAENQAQPIVQGVASVPGVSRHLITGSLRRRRETIGDVDILVCASDAEPVMERFTSFDTVASVNAKGPTKSSVILTSGLQVDLRVVKEEEFAFASHYFTGSKEHNTEIRARAKKMGLRLNEYGLFDSKEHSDPCGDEAALFARLGLDYIAPELRENTGEIEAAKNHTLPALIEEGDIHGVFHCHTNRSDGHNTLAEMVGAADALGHAFFGTGDHSQTAVYAGGLNVDAVRAQRREVDALNRAGGRVAVFHGVESDILADGSLDYPDDVLGELDYVVASVHSQFTMGEAQMTRRIVRAMSNPHTVILGHPTGRILLKRDGYAVNLRTIIDAAVEYEVALEINAHPYRLDLDWRHVRAARDAGAMIVINPDAHNTDEVAYVRYGVGVARKGWLEKKDVLNTRTPSQVRQYLRERRVRRGIA